MGAHTQWPGQRLLLQPLYGIRSELVDQEEEIS